ATATAARPGTAQPDPVTQWNLTMIAGLEAAGIPPPPAARIGAIVQASVFDAVNGIDHRYAYYHLPPAAPHGASRAPAPPRRRRPRVRRLLPAPPAAVRRPGAPHAPPPLRPPPPPRAGGAARARLGRHRRRRHPRLAR